MADTPLLQQLIDAGGVVDDYLDNDAPALLSALTYMLPGIGTVRGIGDAFENFGDAFDGDDFFDAEDLLSFGRGVGDLGLSALSLIPGWGALGNGLAKGGKALGRAARATRKLDNAGNAVAATTPLGRALDNLADIQRIGRGENAVGGWEALRGANNVRRGANAANQATNVAQGGRAATNAAQGGRHSQQALQAANQTTNAAQAGQAATNAAQAGQAATNAAQAGQAAAQAGQAATNAAAQTGQAAANAAQAGGNAAQTVANVVQPAAQQVKAADPRGLGRALLSLMGDAGDAWRTKGTMSKLGRRALRSLLFDELNDGYYDPEDLLE